MKDDSSPPFEPMARYLAGEGTPADHAEVDAWLSADPTHQALFDRLRHAWVPRAVRQAHTDPARMAERVRAAIHASTGAPDRIERSHPGYGVPKLPGRVRGIAPTGHAREYARGHTSRSRTFMAIRATVGVVACAIVAIVVSLGRPFVSRTPATTRTYTTAAGHRATVTFADGSRATLAPSTTMRVSIGGSDKATSITVTGEAMFTVTHHDNHLFTVRTGRVVTRVLGTRFLVRRYPDDASTRVVVADGRVAVHAEVGTAPDAPVVLNANMMGVVSDSGGATVTPDIALDDYIDLTADRLVFHGTAVSDIIAALDRAYAVDIRLSDTTLAAHRVTMTVPVSQRSIDDVLALLTKTLNARYVRNGSVVTITPGGVTHRRLNPFTVETEHGR
jgi:ferric-dicitrate binding protein FerR (iron transport regulator)